MNVILLIILTFAFIFCAIRYFDLKFKYSTLEERVDSWGKSFDNEFGKVRSLQEDLEEAFTRIDRLKNDVSNLKVSLELLRNRSYVLVEKEKAGNGFWEYHEENEDDEPENE